MKCSKLESIINNIKYKRNVNAVSYQDMHLFRHVMATVGHYEPDSRYSGVLVKDKSDQSIVMIHASDKMGDMERGRLYEFIIMPTDRYDTFTNKDEDNCEQIMRSFDKGTTRFVDSIGDSTIVPAGILIYDIYNKDKSSDRVDIPASSKLEILYTNRSLRGQGVATRLKHHFNEILKHRDIDSFFGYSSALDLIDGKDRQNSNEVLKRIYGRMGIHIVPDDPHGLFFGYPKEFQSIDLPAKYLHPLSHQSRAKSIDMSTVKPMAVVEEMSK